MTFNILLSCSSLSLNTDPWTHPHPLHCVLSSRTHTHHTLVNQQLLCTSYLSLPVKHCSLTDWISAAWGYRPTPSSTHCCGPEGRLSGGVFRLSGFSTRAIYTSSELNADIVVKCGRCSQRDRQTGQQTDRQTDRQKERRESFSHEHSAANTLVTFQPSSEESSI